VTPPPSGYAPPGSVGGVGPTYGSWAPINDASDLRGFVTGGRRFPGEVEIEEGVTAEGVRLRGLKEGIVRAGELKLRPEQEVQKGTVAKLTSLAERLKPEFLKRRKAAVPIVTESRLQSYLGPRVGTKTPTRAELRSIGLRKKGGKVTPI
jgi:hypothetical protein